MSVPLDRLYNFLDSINRHNGHDVIIYRFSPHGSRKPEDLTPLNNSFPSWRDQMIHPYVFYHDQEPLNFDYYSKQNFRIQESLIPNHSNLEFDEVVQFKLINPVMQAGFFDYSIICHSEKNSKNLCLYENNEYVGVYWWSHAVIARDWFRYAEHDQDLTANFDNIKHDFLVYNRAWSGTREYRLTLADMILTKNLLDHCHMNFSPLDGENHYSCHEFANPELKITTTNLEEHFALNTANSTSSADYDSRDYDMCAIELVLETLFDDDRLHLTEKSLRPMACGRPFMLAATPGSLEYLRSYGFETFHNFIDESYDLIPNPRDRLQAIVREMQRIIALDHQSKTQLWKELYEIANRNKKRFFSTEFHNDVVCEYIENFNNAMKFMHQNCTAKRWKYIIEKSKTDTRIRHDQDRPHRTAADVVFVNAWLANKHN